MDVDFSGLHLSWKLWETAHGVRSSSWAEEYQACETAQRPLSNELRQLSIGNGTSDCMGEIPPLHSKNWNPWKRSCKRQLNMWVPPNFPSISPSFCRTELKRYCMVELGSWNSACVAHQQIIGPGRWRASLNQIIFKIYSLVYSLIYYV